jgi:hypothetical protein
MQVVLKFVFGVFVFLTLSSSVRAWNAEGHMLVSQIAYNHLAANVKSNCDALIAIQLTNYNSAGTSNFVTAAVWADDFKTPLGTGPYHYIDIPFSLDGTSTSGVPATVSNVVQGLNTCIAGLQNPTLDQTNKAMHLRYLLHYVGDIQQPLHCSTAVSAAHTGGDAGGNIFSLTGAIWSNLHSLWDQGGGYLLDSLPRPFSAATQNTLNAKVAAIEADYPYNYTTNLTTVPNPMTWATEGWSSAQSVCYVGITNNTSPTSSYLATATNRTELYIANGGHRLADLLNTILGSNPVTLNSITITNGRFGFSWYGLSGSTYHLQWKAQLGDSIWNDLTNILAPTNSFISITDRLDQTQRFYRLYK